MFLDRVPPQEKQYYEKMLKNIGSLSHLFSESEEPYIDSRIAENLFCKSFSADNLSRTDCSVDAVKGSMGIGIKTFLEKNGSTMQKVAEFNSGHRLIAGLEDEPKIRKVSQLRNDRIETTKRIYQLDSTIYHCITRKPGRIFVHEHLLESVDIAEIRNVARRGNIILFEDSINSYSFNTSKSTLYKRFITADILSDIHVDILEDPLASVESLFEEASDALSFAPIASQEHVFLPLYSYNREGNKYVPERSGLNQWNASGRPRDASEAYIQIPAWIHHRFPGFFPSRDENFILELPDGSEMSAKVCQDNSKALMSNPNSALGEWLLRDVLNLVERELLDYERLEGLGLDSVVLYKTGSCRYKIDFSRTGSYEAFKQNSERAEHQA